MKKTFVLQSVVEKRARELKKDKSLKLHQARDEAVKELGYSNFKHYKNRLEADIKQYKSSLEVFFKDISLENSISKKMKLAISFMQSHDTPFRDLLDILKLFQNSHELGEHPDFEWLDDVHFVCGKLNLMKDEIESYMLNSFLTGELEHYFHPHFIAKKLLISDVTYEIRNDKIYADGNYHLTVESPRQSSKLEGAFGVSIDRNKKISLKHSDIGVDTDSGHVGGPFTEQEVENYYSHFPDERSKFENILVMDNAGYNDIKRCLSNNEPLTGKALEMALSLVDVHGDDEQSKFMRNIGVKIKAGQPLAEYEHHILVDVLMLHTQLGA